MRAIIVGKGIQGEKRNRIAGDDVVAIVDPTKQGVDYKKIEDIPLTDYDVALLCVPDEPKLELITYLLNSGKHVLVEKPLMVEENRLQAIAHLALSNNCVCYTAYNHRFEPNIMSLRDIVQSGRLGNIYRIRMFYGNGTARDVRDSLWRDKGGGVLNDLGSHLIDTLLFILEDLPCANDWSLWSSRCFENRAPDHVIMGTDAGDVLIELEMSLISWRNHFVCEVYGSKGSAIVDSLCKWGPSCLTLHERILPSGRPPTEIKTLVMEDPTWATEYAHFKSLVDKRERCNLSNDIFISRVLNHIGEQISSRYETA